MSLNKRGLFVSFLLFLSNQLQATPQPITDLRVVEVNFRQIKIRWTAPQSSQPILYYQIRVSTYRVLSTEEDWNNNSTETSYPYVVEIDTTSQQGETATYTFTNLENFKIYFFAIKSSTSPNKIPLSEIDSNPIRPYGQPVNTQPLWTEIPLNWPIYEVLVTSKDVVTFDFKDVYDPDVPYGDTIKYELYYSTKASALFGTTPPLLYGAHIGVVFNLTTSYVEIHTNNFIDNTTYYWRVRAVDSQGSYVWSIDNQDISKFVINHTPEPPSTFTLLSPLYASKINSIPNGVFFDWTEPSDKDPNDLIKYSIYISSTSENKNFSLVVSEIIWSSFTLGNVFGGGWAENKKYWWFVEAKDSYNLSSFSSTFYFIVNNYEEPPQQNLLISPGTTIYYPLNVLNQNHILFSLNPTFYWTPSYDLDLETTVYYQLFISSFSDDPTELNSLFYTTTQILTTYYYLTGNILQNQTTYFWRVRVWDNPYSGYAVYSSTVFWFYTFTTNTPPTAAILKFPPNNFTTSYFYLKFEWELGEDKGFNAAVSSQTIILWNNQELIQIPGLSSNTTFYVFSQPLKNNTTYFWQVITYDNGYPPPQLSSASYVNSFYIKNSSPLVFNLLSPSQGEIITTQNIQLFWQQAIEPDNEPISYKVVYSTDNFLSFFSSEGVKNTNFIINNLKDNTTYWWYVYAYDKWNFTCGASSTFYFVVDNIEQLPLDFNLILPPNNSLSFVTSASFYWQTTFDPDPFENITYMLIISTNSTLTPIYFSTQTINPFFYLPDGALSINTTYYWNVLAVSSRSGEKFASNGPFKFFIYNTAPTKPILAYPINGQVVKEPSVNLIWSMSIDLQSDYFYYELYITTNNINFNKFILPSFQNEFNLNLVDDTTYFWYVVVIDTYNNKNQSDIFVFYSCYENSPPTKPIILQPSNGQNITLPYTILWSTSTDTDIFDSVSYRLEISTTSDFTYKVLVTSQTATFYTLKEYHFSFATYYLRVVSYDKHNEEAYSDVVSFTISPYYIEIISPLNQQLIEKLPLNLSYSKVEPVVLGDTITYKISLSSHSSFVYKQEITSFSTFYLISNPPMPAATYFWYVEVFDSYLRKAKTPIYSFIIPDTPPKGLSEIFVSTSSDRVELLWMQPDNIENLWGYRIYKGYSLEKLALIDFTTGYRYIDKYGLEGEFYYTVKTVNQFGIESRDNIYVKLYNSQQVDVYFSEDGVVSVMIPKTENITSLDITKLPQLESELYPYVYEITSEKKQTENFIQIQFLKPQDINFYTIQYYDGHLWQDFPSFEAQGKINITTQYLGRYRLSVLYDKKEPKLTIIGCSPKKRIITPNNDGINDYIEFQFEVGSYIFGYLYDMNFKKVCRLKSKDKHIIYFDGRDENGDLLPAGIYIYNITAQPSNRNFTGTVIIKY